MLKIRPPACADGLVSWFDFRKSSLLVLLALCNRSGSGSGRLISVVRWRLASWAPNGPAQELGLLVGWDRCPLTTARGLRLSCGRRRLDLSRTFHTVPATIGSIPAFDALRSISAFRAFVAILTFASTVLALDAVRTFRTISAAVRSTLRAIATTVRSAFRTVTAIVEAGFAIPVLMLWPLFLARLTVVVAWLAILTARRPVVIPRLAFETRLRFVYAHLRLADVAQARSAEFVATFFLGELLVAHSRRAETADLPVLRQRLTVLHLLLAVGHDDAIVVLGVLQIVLCQHRVSGRQSIARQLHVFLGDMRRRAADFRFRAAAFIAS